MTSASEVSEESAVSSSSRIRSMDATSALRSTQIGLPHTYTPRENGYGTKNRSQLEKSFFLNTQRPGE